MRYIFHHEMRKNQYYLYQRNSLMIIFTVQGSIRGQNRSKLVDSSRIYHGAPTVSDLGVET